MNKTKGLLLTAAVSLAMAFTFSGCNEKEAAANTFTDPRDGKAYKKVKIGEQVWMAENLNYAAEGSVCCENKDENCAKYGHLYTFKAAKTACPEGWHLPSEEEWTALENAVGGAEAAHTKLISKTGWNQGEYGNGTDEYGFSALPGGRGDKYGDSGGVGDYGGWWGTDGYAWGRGIYEEFVSGGGNQDYQFSVRCVKDGGGRQATEQLPAEENGKFIPKGYRLFEEMHGDLNGDGKDDYIAIIKGTDKKQMVKSENSGELRDRNRRGILIFFINGNDYQLALENRSCFASENEEGGTYFPPELSVSTGKGNLYIGYNWGKYGTWKYTFRYRNGEFALIGYDGYSRDVPVSGEGEREIEVVEINTSYNLLTKKAMVGYRATAPTLGSPHNVGATLAVAHDATFLRRGDAKPEQQQPNPRRFI